LGPHQRLLQATPIEVGQILRGMPVAEGGNRLLTSATLAVGGGFDYIRQRLGLDSRRESIVPSHFDYQSQVILYVPPDLPDPRTPQFAAQAPTASSTCWKSRAGALSFLFTSYAQMNEIYDRLLGVLDFPMLKQGDARSPPLEESIRASGSARSSERTTT